MLTHFPVLTPSIRKEKILLDHSINMNGHIDCFQKIGGLLDVLQGRVVSYKPGISRRFGGSNQKPHWERGMVIF